MAGHLLKVRFEGGHVITEDRCWWDVDCRSENMLRDYDACREQLREALLAAADERCFDGRNGVFLSGGIDSTILTGAASTLLGRQIDSFTVGFREEAYDESPRAKIAAEAHHTDHHVYVLDYNEALGELDRIIAGFDQPFADDSAVPTWVINRFAAEQGLVNVLTGDGSDQIFAGSSKYFIRHYVDKIMKFPRPLRALGKAAVFALPDRSAATRKMRKVMACVDMDPYEMRRRMLQLGLDEKGLAALLMGEVADRETDAVARLYAVNRDRTDELTNTLYVDLKVVADGAMMTKMGQGAGLERQGDPEGRLPRRDPAGADDRLEKGLHAPGGGLVPRAAAGRSARGALGGEARGHGHLRSRLRRVAHRRARLPALQPRRPALGPVCVQQVVRHGVLTT